MFSGAPLAPYTAVPPQVSDDSMELQDESMEYVASDAGAEVEHLSLSVSIPVRRRVSFQEGRTEIYVPSFACLSDEERRQIWHEDIEIEGFKTQTRALCEELKAKQVRGESTRGLELRLSQDRQFRKYMVLQAILRAQKRFKDPMQLSTIARKCSAWSNAVAAIEAQRDFCSVYDPSRMASVGNEPSMDDYPLPFKSKVPPKLLQKRPISPVPARCVRQRRPTPQPATAMLC